MKSIHLLIATGLIAGSASPALADRPGPDWMPLDQAHKALVEAGYRDVTKIEADDGHWEAKVTKDGRRVQVRIDPRTGAIAEKPRKR